MKEREQITSKDVFQFSDLEDATVVICEKVKAHNNLGVKYIDVGKILLDDGKEKMVHIPSMVKIMLKLLKQWDYFLN